MVFLLFVVSSIFSTTVFGEINSTWTYKQQKQWEGLCSTGREQSPIDISTKLFEGFPSWSNVPYITGGGLSGKYNLAQFHMHWDISNQKGSENTINRKHYSSELHFVHYREGLTAETAGTVTGGTAVLAVFLKLAADGPALKDMIPAFARTIKPGSNDTMTLTPDQLLPKDRSTFLRYNGSLTTPPCTEGVIWTILTQPSFIDRLQLTILRKHLSEPQKRMRNVWRAPQPVNERKVYINKDNFKL